MKTQKPYLTQYCNLCFEWKINKIDIDEANETQLKELNELREKALNQSGLTLNELYLISICRNYNIFVKVKSYANKIKDIL